MPRFYLFPHVNNGFLQTKEWKKMQIEYVQDSKIVKFMVYREKNMLNSPSFGGKDNYFRNEYVYRLEICHEFKKHCSKTIIKAKS